MPVSVRGIAARLAREADDLLPRPPVALRRVEVRQPAVAAGGHAPEHGVDVAADEDGRTRLLDRARAHHGLAQVELVDLEAHALLRPEAGEDVEVALEEPAPLLERHAHRVELARVPAGGHAQDEPALGDDVEGAQGLGRDGGVAQRQHHDPGAELDGAGARGDGGEDAHRVQDGKRRLHAEDDVIPRPQRLEAQRLGALGVGEEGVDVGGLRRGPRSS